MAKKHEENFDLDMDMDFDLDKELGSLSFGESKSEPPKNAREAVMNSIKDAKSGFMEGFKNNKLEIAGKLASSSIPSNLRSEYQEIAELYGNTKEMVSKGLDDIKDATGGLLKAVNKMVPQNGKLAKLLEKLTKKFEKEQYEKQKGPSKEEIEKQKIQEGILASLGELTEKSHNDAMIQQAIASKQHATTAELLQNVYAESKLQRTFHYEITNKYYRKSLELQYKQLFTLREQLELTRVGFDTFKNQLESVILNTALPDLIKTRNSEFIKADLMKKMRAGTMDTLYKSIKPLESMKQAFQGKVQKQIDSFINGLKGTTDMIGMSGDMAEMTGGMGMSKANMVGSAARGFFLDYLGNKIGNKLGDTKLAKKIGFNMKDIMADPRYALQKMMNNTKNMKGIKGKALTQLANMLYGLTSDPSQNRTTYGRVNLDDPHPFDGRTHTTINKVIPQLLGKIYGELKASRIGGNADDHELRWNDHNDTLSTKAQLKDNIKQQFSRNMQNSSAGYINQILAILKNAGVNLSKQDGFVLGQALIGKALSSGMPLAPSLFWDPGFIQSLADPKLQAALGKGRRKLQNYLMNDRYGQYDMEGLSAALFGLKNSMKGGGKLFQNMYNSGNADVLAEMGLGQYDAGTGNFIEKGKGVHNLIAGSYNQNMVDGNTITADMVGKSSSIVGKRLGKKLDNAISGVVSNMPNSINKGINKFNGVIQQAIGVAGAASRTTFDKIRSELKAADTETVVDYFSSQRSRAEEFLEPLQGKAKSQARSVFNDTKKFYNKQITLLSRQLEKADNPATRENIQDIMVEVKEQAGDFVRTMQTEGLSAISIDKFKSSITDLVQNAKKRIPNNSSGITNKITDNAQQSPSSQLSPQTNNINKNETKDGNRQNTAAGNRTGGIIGAVQSYAANPYAAIGGALNKMFEKKRKVDELRAEYFNSEEYKSGAAPSFLGWVKAMGYNVEENEPLWKRALKKTREWDRKMAGFLIKSPFKAIAGILKFPFKKKKGVIGKSIQAGVGGATKVGQLALDMLPFGMGHILQPFFSTTTAILELTKLKAKDDEKDDKNRKGGWMSRLNLFGGRKKGEKEDPKKDGDRANKLAEAAKKFGMTALIAGGIGLLSKMGVSLGDIAEGVKKVVSGVIDVGKKIWDIGSKVGEWLGAAFNNVVKGLRKIPFIGEFFGEDVPEKIANPNYDPNKPEGPDNPKEIPNPNYKDPVDLGTASLVGGAAATGAALYAVRHPIKTVTSVFSAGQWLFEKMMNLFSSNPKEPVRPKPDVKSTSLGSKILGWLGDKLKYVWEKTGGKLFNAIKQAGMSGARYLLEKAKDVIIKAGDKAYKMWKSAKSQLKRLVRILTSKTIIKALGKSVAINVAKRVAALAAGGTGIGLIITVGFAVWDLCWILWYWLAEDYSLVDAILCQFLGIDMKDKECQELIAEAEKDPDAEANAEAERDAMENQAAMEDVHFQDPSSPITTSPVEQQSKPSAAEQAIKTAEQQTQKMYQQQNNPSSSSSAGSSSAPPRTSDSKKIEENAQVSGSPSEMSTSVDRNYVKDKPGNTIDYNIDPDLLQRLNYAGKVYKEKTGKPLIVSEGRRSTQKQIEYWTRGTTRYPAPGKHYFSGILAGQPGGTKAEERKRLMAKAEEFKARGKTKEAAEIIAGLKNASSYGYPGGSPHGSGRAVDLSVNSLVHNEKTMYKLEKGRWVEKTPGYLDTNDKSLDVKLPILDYALGQAGLHRKFQAANNHTGSLREFWHVEKIGGKNTPIPQNDPAADTPRSEMTKPSGQEQADINNTIKEEQKETKPGSLGAAFGFFDMLKDSKWGGGGATGTSPAGGSSPSPASSYPTENSAPSTVANSPAVKDAASTTAANNATVKNTENMADIGKQLNTAQQETKPTPSQGTSVNSPTPTVKLVQNTTANTGSAVATTPGGAQVVKASFSPYASDTTTSSDMKSMLENFTSGSVEEILVKSLAVQFKSMMYLEEIRNVFTGKGKDSGGPNAQSTGLPAPAIDIKRREEFPVNA